LTAWPLPGLFFVINNYFDKIDWNSGISMPGVEIKGYFQDIHNVNTYLNAWSGNKGGKIGFLDIFLTFQ